MQDEQDHLLAAIDAYEQSATGGDYDGGELAHQRSLALRAYAGENLMPAPEGQSQVVDRTVFETVQWILPALMRIFAGGDNVVEFEPTGPEDEDVAKQESEYLNHLVTQKNNWFLTCLTWIQDALITKNAYCMGYIDEKITPEIERYEGQSQEQITMLLEDDVEIVGSQENVDEDNPIPVIDPQTGQPAVDPATGQPMMQPSVSYDVEIKRVKTKKRLAFKVLPPEQCRVGEDTDNFTLDECNYFEFWDIVTISDLRKDGFDVDDDIADDYDTDSLESEARDENLGLFNDSFDSPDRSMRQVVVRHIWIRHDHDGDGIAELQYCVVVGRTVLSHEPVSRIPVACIVPFINTHKHSGISIADLVFDIGQIKTKLLRGGLDSLDLSIKPRHAISDKVNLDDMLVHRSGSVVRLRDGAVPGEGHIMPLPTEFVFQQAQAGLQHMDTVVEARAGVNRQFQGMDASANNDHNRIGQLSTMASQRVEMIARLMANGFERLFSIGHELVIKSGHQAESMKLRGEWVDIDPSQWSTGRDMRIVAPFAAGNKDALLNRLMMIAGLQEKALTGGLPIVDANDAYEMALEIASAADVSGDKFFTDPATIPPQEPPPDYTAIALEIENKKADSKAKEIDTDAEIKRYEIDTEAAAKEFVSRLTSETQIAIAQLRAGEAVNLETIRAQLKGIPTDIENGLIDATQGSLSQISQAVGDSINQLAEQVETLKRLAESPREIVRDEKGRATGVKVGGNITAIKRDANGKVTGL